MLLNSYISFPAIAVDGLSVAIVYYSVAAGGSTNGVTAGAWTTLTLDTIGQDDDGIVSLSSNQVELEAGDYVTEFWGNFSLTDQSQVRLYNATDTSEIAVSMGSYHKYDRSGNGPAHGKASFTFFDTKNIELQYRTARTGTNGASPDSDINGGMPNALRIIKVPA
jgi:hypothetical protein